MLLHNLKVKGAQLFDEAETYANLRPVLPPSEDLALAPMVSGFW
jgi:hypothetical protein